MCAQLRRNVLGYRVAAVAARNDALLLPFLKQSSDPEKDLDQFRQRLVGSTVSSVGRHGKYFWLRLQVGATSESQVLLMHFGMTGMIKIKDVASHLVFMENGGDKKVLDKKQVKTETNTEVKTEDWEENDEWPPRFSKLEFVLESNDTKLDIAFSDPRRLGRIRLLTGPEVQTDADLLTQPPLNALGPDYSKPAEFTATDKFVEGDPDPDHHGRPRLELAEFNALVLSKKKPIKSLLLDQAYFSGVGNWVSDEIVYRARILPGEVLSQKISQGTGIDPVIARLYDALIYVCLECVRVEGNVSRFPPDWLMLYRWGKARTKVKARTADGYVVDYVTVGGRTACFVPQLQKPLKKTTDKVPESQEPSPKRIKRERA